MTKRYKLLSKFNKKDEKGNMLCRNFAECKNPVKKPYRYYCSKDCQQKIIHEAYSFEYFRSDCLKRDNYTCQYCGVKADYSSFNSNIIEVHHILPVQYGGSNDISNGITLCQKCHLKAHRELKNERLLEKLKLKKLDDFKKIEEFGE
jgi:hypothetical protein